MEDDRYRYEVAERIMDKYSEEHGTYSFQRTYRKFKALIAAMAYVDFYADGVPMPQAMAWEWEDVQMGFVGRGESIMTGAIIQLWLFVGKAEQDAYAAMLKSAFEEAEKATSAGVPRRFLAQWRHKPMRRPEEGFTEAPILPCWGPRVREWAVEEGKDPSAEEIQFSMLEESERKLLEEARVKKAGIAAAKAATAAAPPAPSTMKVSKITKAKVPKAKKIVVLPSKTP